MSLTNDTNLRVRIKEAIQLLESKKISINCRALDVVGSTYFINTNNSFKGYKDLDKLLDHVCPPPRRETPNERIDKLEQKVLELTQQLNQQATSLQNIT